MNDAGREWTEVSRLRLIDADKFEAFASRLPANDNPDYNTGYIHGMERVLDEIDAAPTADVAPVVHGEVVFRNRHRKSFKRYTGFDDIGEEHTITVREESEGKEPYCGVCGCQLAESSLNYCPGCGAKMDGGTKDETD